MNAEPGVWTDAFRSRVSSSREAIGFRESLSMSDGGKEDKLRVRLYEGDLRAGRVLTGASSQSECQDQAIPG